MDPLHYVLFSRERSVTPPLLTPQRVAEMLGVSVELTYKVIRKGLLPAVRIGSSIRVIPEDLDRFILEKRSADPRPSRKCPSHEVVQRGAK
jgi:excisionase family DNA binding protein